MTITVHTNLTQEYYNELTEGYEIVSEDEQCPRTRALWEALGVEDPFGDWRDDDAYTALLWHPETGRMIATTGWAGADLSVAIEEPSARPTSPDPTVNRIAGQGMASHDVPTVPLLSVLMRDAHHQGTLVTLLPDRRYCFVSLDSEEVAFADRVALVDILVDVDDFAVDLSCVDVAIAFEQRALALIGCERGDEWDPTECEVLWDSAEETGQ